MRENKNKKISFFYPSTKNIDYDKKSIYSKIKRKAELKINAFCSKNKIPIYIHRYLPINSKQSLTLLNQNLPSLLEYLEKNKQVINKIFPDSQKNYWGNSLVSFLGSVKWSLFKSAIPEVLVNA